MEELYKRTLISLGLEEVGKCVEALKDCDDILLLHEHLTYVTGVVKTLEALWLIDGQRREYIMLNVLKVYMQKEKELIKSTKRL